MSRYNPFFAVALATVSTITLMGCGKPATAPAPEPAVSAPQPAAAPAVDAAREAALAAKEQALAQREEKLALQAREQDLAQREALVAAEQAEQKKLAAAKPVPKKRAAAPKVVHADGEASHAAPPEPPRPVVVTPIVVPAGTQLTVALSSDLSTKTAHAGDTFEARLVSDLIVDGRRAAAAGSLVTGSVTDVVSGSKTIGGVPTLGLRFDSLVLETNEKISISGELLEKGKSDTGRDTAKILGGAAAGAILGHQVKKDNSGKVIGGVLGGAIGAVIAKNTGTEVELAANSTLTIALGAPFEVKPR